MPPAVEFPLLTRVCCGIGTLVFPHLILFLLPCTFLYFTYITNIVIDFFGFGKLVDSVTYHGQKTPRAKTRGRIRALGIVPSLNLII